jgi:hypothetical protein
MKKQDGSVRGHSGISAESRIFRFQKKLRRSADAPLRKSKLSRFETGLSVFQLSKISTPKPGIINIGENLICCRMNLAR